MTHGTTHEGIPKELEETLASAPDADRAFARLARSHRREYVQWIAEAKRPATRQRRTEQAITMLREKARCLDSNRLPRRSYV